MPSVLTKHRSISMTFVESTPLAEMLFNRPVIDADALLRASLAYTPYNPTWNRTQEFGTDISVYNGTLDPWPYRGYYVKLIDGVSYQKYIHYTIIRGGQSWGYEDPRFILNVLLCELIGIPWMVYWVIFPSQPIEAQVDKFMSVMRKLWVQLGRETFGDGPIWIDFELHNEMSSQALNAALLSFATRLKAATGHRVGIYTGNWFLSAYCKPYPNWYIEFPHWWLAEYLHPSLGLEHPGPIPSHPALIPVENIDFHQVGSYFDAIPMGAMGDGNIRIDGNRYIGRKPLTEYLGRTQPPPPEEGPITLEQVVAMLHQQHVRIETLDSGLSKATRSLVGIREAIEVRGIEE